MATATTHDRASAVPTNVRHPLEKLRGTIRRYVILDGLVALGVFLAAWFWIGLALDYGSFKIAGLDSVQVFPKSVRVALLVLPLLDLVALLVGKFALRVFRDFSYPSLALVLERRFPDVLGDRLITAVELADL